MALPFLPGNSFDRKVGQNKHHLSHHFDTYNGVNLFVGEEKPGVGGTPLAGQDLRPKNSVYPRGEGPDRPAWVAFDKQVLNFDAYFQESVVERPNEQYRVRNVKVMFYLEDDTIQVNEPRSKNAGYNQGTIIRRHRIPHPPPYDDTFYTIEDFNLQKEVEFYGKKFKLTDCDQFTRNFLTKLGVRVPVPLSTPDDPYQKIRSVQDGTQNPLRPYERVDTLKQFLDHDRHVLRFNCVWDDRDQLHGDLREFILHYFLSDNTIEIREVLPPNSGRDTSSLFLNRQRLPKDITQMGKPGDKPHRTVLNVIGNFFDGGRYILDNLKTGAIHVDYYNDSDLMINKTINVFGRSFTLINCDEFTRDYYRTKFGVKDFTPLSVSKRQPGVVIEKQNPPYTGFGSEEDSLASHKKLIPEPPKKDFIKWMGYDRQGYESNQLRFLAKLITKDPIQADRRFIITYFLSDDTLLVYEPPIRNSGIDGGKFLERQQVKKPNQPRYPTNTSEVYTYRDLFVGAVVLFHSFQFYLYDADEYCYKFMENNPSMFPLANVESIKGKLFSFFSTKSANDVSALFKQHDPSDRGYVGFETFYSIIKNHFSNLLSEQEIVTLSRHYAHKKVDEYDFQSVIAVAQEHLRKHNFENFSKLKEALVSRDARKTDCTLPSNEVRNACKGMHLPIPDYVLNLLVTKMTTENGTIDYQDFVKAINWRDYPVAYPKQSTIEPRVKGEGKEFEITTMERQQLNVNYNGLLDEAFGPR